ncbi:ankyrin repeat domain-containing protein [Coxiella endosymbiont of Ornithodoros amblus]|uniref:ankyrin repeat domain-containing protein n=1 Tax=Coxiella endosymbiont of Ornithodoros amblus TaxID=1656166 RepID=UPI00244DDD1D|nr:ankyrin repeat domain-containing protein [Coxiella endosymbiont of Ornithodoros amblus]
MSISLFFYGCLNPPNRTAFHIAAKFNQLVIVKYLVEEKGHNPKGLLPGGLAPLQETACGPAGVIKYLIFHPGIRGWMRYGELHRFATLIYYILRL